MLASNGGSIDSCDSANCGQLRIGTAVASLENTHISRVRARSAPAAASTSHIRSTSQPPWNKWCPSRTVNERLERPSAGDDRVDIPCVTKCLSTHTAVATRQDVHPLHRQLINYCEDQCTIGWAGRSRFYICRGFNISHNNIVHWRERWTGHLNKDHI